MGTRGGAIWRRKRENHARSTILAGGFHMSTPLMSLSNSGRLRRHAEAGVSEVRDAWHSVRILLKICLIPPHCLGGLGRRVLDLELQIRAGGGKQRPDDQD